MSSISRIPAGILGFLGIKNGGQYPQRLTADLVPTWDLSALYLAYGAQVAGLTSNFNSIGYTQCISPPPGEVWVLHDFSVAAQAGAGEAAKICLARAPNAAVNVVDISDQVDITASTTKVAVLMRPIILCPGDTAGFSAYDLTGTISIYAAWNYTILTM